MVRSIRTSLKNGFLVYIYIVIYTYLVRVVVSSGWCIHIMIMTCWCWCIRFLGLPSPFLGWSGIPQQKPRDFSAKTRRFNISKSSIISFKGLPAACSIAENHGPSTLTFGEFCAIYFYCKLCNLFTPFISGAQPCNTTCNPKNAGVLNNSQSTGTPPSFFK